MDLIAVRYSFFVTQDKLILLNKYFYRGTHTAEHKDS